MSKARDLADGTFDTDTLVVDAANNRVGFGTSSPLSTIDARGIIRGYQFIPFTDTDSAALPSIAMAADSDTGFFRPAGNTIGVSTGATERMRLTSTGNLLVHKTSPDQAVEGMEFAASNYLLCTKSGGTTAYFNRTSSDGSIAEYRKDGTTVGNIGAASGNVYFATNGGSNQCGIAPIGGSDPRVVPCNATGSAVDNGVDLGYSNARWDDIWATNGTIQTSDRNDKQDIEELDEAEKRVATAAKGLIRKFRWIDAVAEKGDDARIHVGVIAQDLQAAFEAEGLDAGRYAMFISSTWWEADEVIPAVAEELDEDGNVITEAQPERTVKRTYETAEEAPEGAVERTRLGVRYPELLAFIIGAL